MTGRKNIRSASLIRRTIKRRNISGAPAEYAIGCPRRDEATRALFGSATVRFHFLPNLGSYSIPLSFPLDEVVPLVDLLAPP